VLPYADFGVKLYGNVIIASPKILRENPAAVKAFLTALAKGAKEVMANPDPSIDYVKQRDGIIDVALERRRLRMAIDAVVASPDARKEGFGVVVPARLKEMAEQVSEAFATKTPVNAANVWTDAFLPSKADLDILPRK
jgi:NitT/TauT family transport system substrate-binding protein